MKPPVAFVRAALFIWAAAAAAQTPSAGEQSRMLDAARASALNYSRSLPDFVCLERVRRYADWQLRNEWTRIDELTIDVTYFSSASTTG